MSAIETLVEFAPVFVVFPVMAYIIKMALNHSTRKHLIEKGLVGDEAAKLFKTDSETFLPSSLKWGLVLTFVGVVIVILQILPTYVSSEVYFGVMLIAAGAAMLIYYGLASMKAKEEEKKKIE